MNSKARSLAGKINPIGMLVVGTLFLVLGFARYPAFIVVGVLYVIIALRGLPFPKTKNLVKKDSDKAQLESL